MKIVSSRTGFTLLELSIVLVIIGLIIGGVLVGRDMMLAAKMRNIASQVEKTVTAIQTFKTKYNALPGDMINATDFWPADSSCPNTTGNSIIKTETCNGNGDGRIGTNFTILATTGWPSERFRIWQHLGNAELIAGKYSGTTTNAGSIYYVDSTPGINVPPLSADPWQIMFITYLENAAGWNGVAATNGWLGSAEIPLTGNVIMIGIPAAMANSGFVGGSSPYLKGTFTPQQALSFDTKYDDSLPGSGRIRARYQDLPAPASWNPCTNPQTMPTARYYTTQSSINCSLFYPNAF